MANIPAVYGRMLFPSESQKLNIPGLVVVRGSFETNSTSDVTNVRGDGFGVNRTGVGVFDITFGNPYPMLVCATATMQADTADTLDVCDVQVGTYNSTTGVLEVFTRSVAKAGSTVIDAPAYSTGNKLTSNAFTAAEAGYVLEPILGDTTVITKVLQSGVPAATQCTVTYAAGIPTLTFAAADSYSTCDFLFLPTSGTSSATVAALTDFDGPRVNFCAVFQSRNSLAVTKTA